MKIFFTYGGCYDYYFWALYFFLKVVLKVESVKWGKRGRGMEYIPQKIFRPPAKNYPYPIDRPHPQKKNRTNQPKPRIKKKIRNHLQEERPQIKEPEQKPRAHRPPTKERTDRTEPLCRKTENLLIYICI
jgi:hypothetical protein